MNGPRITELDIWGRHEKEVLTILTEALLILCRTAGDLPDNETEINRELVLKMREVNWKRRKIGFGILNTISFEMKSQPRNNNGPGSSRERKIPDIQWGFVDEHAMDPDSFECYYCIECKRLGKGFNKLYVSEGIVRFTSKEYSYAKGVRSAAMVAYIQSMTMQEILVKVNNELTRRSIETISGPVGRWAVKGVTRLEQTLERPEVPPTPFQLRHFWADICCG